ncbi:acyltransferase [Microbispora sp. RL4-1S]|uniref:Acyltransferase n=1 Tax=Microbispora oryzae TaxID=2806554 RepID=A0A940WUQ9_9ACTN|nr:acyltransferase [Microbispora oryzae]MBP2707745.1 acyltransferase [Microbispora oryzae]
MRVEPPVATDDAPTAARRRPELDLVRMIVVVGLVFFHASLVFDSQDDYYVKNAQTVEFTSFIAGVAVLWAMPVLFFIAGFGARHSLRRRGPGGFAVERMRRLGVPLAFATVTLIPVPQWLRLRADPAYHESYWRFLPRFFRIRFDLTEFPFVIQGEHFETGHLWFVVLLLAFSLMLAPVVRLTPARVASAARERLAALAARRGFALLAGLPLGLVSALLGLEKEYAGWSRWAYLIFFLYGFAFAADGRLRDALRRDTPIVVVCGLVFPSAGLPMFLMAPGDPFTGMAPAAVAARALYGVAGWCWVLGILALIDRLGRRRAAREDGGDGNNGGRTRRRVYAYLAEGVLPIYVLHQPVVVAVAYPVVRWDAPIAVKYAVIATVSLVLTLAVYDLLVRRLPPVRLLFGMRPRPPRGSEPRTKSEPRQKGVIG